MLVAVVLVVGFVSDSVTPGNAFVGSSAATLSAPAPEAGEPVMYGLAPSFPEAATTITPSFAAFVAAWAAGSSVEPNGEPSDRLITSMPFWTAQSIASRVRLVGPWQPKILIAYRSAFGATPGPTAQVLSETVVAL